MNRKDLYFTWEKGKGGQLSANLHAVEFECKCQNDDCKEQRVAVELIDKLQHLRLAANSPMRIHSGFRCRKHQAALTKNGHQTAKGLSQHELGRAADVSVSALPALQLRVHAKRLFKAIGTAENFLHLDLRDDKERAWNYQFVVRG